MSLENFSDKKIIKDAVILELRNQPQTFYDLLDKFGIPREIQSNGSYCEEYLQLLDTVSLLENQQKTKSGEIIPPTITCAKKVGEYSFVLYLTEDERKLIKSGKVRIANSQSKIAISEYFELLKAERLRKKREIINQ